jgi:predicted AAA+ superfamily ATPase
MAWLIISHSVADYQLTAYIVGMVPATGPLPAPLPRVAADRLARALSAMPVVVLMGARQTGKSTIAAELSIAHESVYVSLDARAMLDRALADPETFASQAGPDGHLAIDEVQRAPDLLVAVKLLVDRAGQRIPGQFLLTGSANLLLMKRVNESLAGRASYVTIWPMTRREQLGLGSAGIWSELLAAPVSQWRELVLDQPAPFEDWRELARRGGYPRPAVHLDSPANRAEWFAGYVDTYLERDIPELSPIASIPDLRRLMRSLAMRGGTLVNLTQLSRDTSIPQTTVRRYVDLLDVSYQIVRLPAFTASRTKRLIKTPKLYWSDTGLAMHLAGDTAPRGEHLEAIVIHDLLAWSQTELPSPNVMYWRTASGFEVDIVVEAGNRLLPIEVKATTQPSSGDLNSMRAFMEEYGDQVAGGLLLHGGEDTFWIAKNVLATPWWTVV